jgi:ribonuclease P protein component
VRRSAKDAGLLAHLSTAEQFAAVLDASKGKGLQSVAQAAQQPSLPAGTRRSAHFAMHLAPAHVLAGRPVTQAVIGVICPKRWAKRAVTRNTIKRQVYAVSSEFASQLPAGYIVVRLAASFAREQFKSATSAALKQAVRQELLGLFGKLLAPTPAGAA